MTRSSTTAERPRRRRGLTNDGPRQAPAPAHGQARAPAHGHVAADATTAPMPPRKPGAAYEAIDAAAEIARRAIVANDLGLRAELMERQRQAIETIRQSAIAALRLAEALAETGQADESPGNPHERRGRSAALHNSAINFVRSAAGLIGAIAGMASAAWPPDAACASADGGAIHPPALTDRQQRVLALLLGGLPNKLIAHQLGVTEATVKAHVSQVLHKFKVHSRAQVIARMSGRTEAQPLN